MAHRTNFKHDRCYRVDLDQKRLYYCPLCNSRITRVTVRIRGFDTRRVSHYCKTRNSHAIASIKPRDAAQPAID